MPRQRQAATPVVARATPRVADATPPVAPATPAVPPVTPRIARYWLKVMISRGSVGFFREGSIVTADELGGAHRVALWTALGAIEPVTEGEAAHEHH